MLEDPLKKYRAIRQQSLHICKPLQAEDYTVQPETFVSPPKWHLAHTTWFYETFILRDIAGYKAFDERFGFLFNSYYEHEGERVLRSKRGLLSRPSINEVRSYRQYVDEKMESCLSNGLLSNKQLELLELGLHHEQQHQELLWYDIKYILGKNPLFPAYSKEPVFDFSTCKKEMGWIAMEQGLHAIGHDGAGFCFDNEQARHEVFVPAFEIADRLVSNAEYLEFIEADGYSEFNYWLAEGWDWVQESKIKAPLYWVQQDKKWKEYSLNGLADIQLDQPVKHISYYEADAFARWKQMRLPTEFEWEVAAGSFEHGALWELTQSAYQAYPGFIEAEGAVGEYNGKFMVNQKVLRGGSVASPKGHVRKTYRNFFHPEMRWMFSGIRLVKNHAYAQQN